MIQFYCQNISMTASQVYESQPLVAYIRLWRVIFLSFSYVIFLSLYFGQITLTQVDVMLFLVHFSVLCISLVFFSCQDMDVFLGRENLGSWKYLALFQQINFFFRNGGFWVANSMGAGSICMLFFQQPKKDLFFQNF